jgi:hypothetical protein
MIGPITEILTEKLALYCCGKVTFEGDISRR